MGVLTYIKRPVHTRDVAEENIACNTESNRFFVKFGEVLDGVLESTDTFRTGFKIIIINHTRKRLYRSNSLRAGRVLVHPIIICFDRNCGCNKYRTLECVVSWMRWCDD